VALSDIVLAYIRGGAYNVLSPYAKGQWSAAEAIDYLRFKFPSLIGLSEPDAREILRQYDISRTTARHLMEFMGDSRPPAELHGCMPGLDSEFGYAVVTQYRLPGEDRARTVRNVQLFDKPASRNAIMKSLPETVIDDYVASTLGISAGLPEIESQIIVGAYRRC